jgi:alpha-glucosidase
LYQQLIQLRRKEPALSVGDYAALPASDDLMAHIRKSADRRFLVALNFAGQSRSFNLDELQARGAVLRLSTYLDRKDERLENELVLRADEGVIVELV